MTTLSRDLILNPLEKGQGPMGSQSEGETTVHNFSKLGG